MNVRQLPLVDQIAAPRSNRDASRPSEQHRRRRNRAPQVSTAVHAAERMPRNLVFALAAQADRRPQHITHLPRRSLTTVTTPAPVVYGLGPVTNKLAVRLGDLSPLSNRGPSAMLLTHAIPGAILGARHRQNRLVARRVVHRGLLRQ
jgi:hypothetical protein